MKTNRFLFILLSVLSISLGLNAQTFHQKIEWKGVERWTTDQTQGLVLVYEGANYTSANSLGYYVATIDVPADFSLDNHTVSLENVRLARLSSEEAQAVAPYAETVLSSLALETELISKGNYNQLRVKFLPLLKLKHGDSFRKVAEFDVVIRKQANGSRPARAVGELQIFPETLNCVILGEEYGARFWVNDATLGTDYRYRVSEGQLPEGLVLIEEDGVIERQPDSDYYAQVVSYGPFTIQASNGMTTLTREYEILTDCPYAKLIKPNNGQANCGVYSGQFTMSDPNIAVVYSPVGSLPDGLTLTADGLVSGTVSLPSTQITVQAVTEDGCVYKTNLTITDTAFSLNNAFLRRGVLSVPYEDWLKASGGTAPYTYSAVNLPQGLTVVANGKISGTPAVSGQFAVTIATTDARGCTRNTTFTLTVAENSVLATGNWYKIRVPETGNSTGTTIYYTPEKRIYKLTYEDLAQMEGINPNQDIHVFGYGGAMLSENISTLTNEDLPELPVYIEKGADGIFNAGDYILFYAQGPVSWSYDNFTDGSKTWKEFVRTRNPYSNYGYYFVASGLGTPTLEPAQAEEFSNNEYPSETIDRGVIRILHENELVNLANSGRNWYGETFTSSTLNREFQITIPDYVSGSIYVRSKAVAKSPVGLTSLRLYANGAKINYNSTDATFVATGSAGMDAYASAKFSSKDIAGTFNNGNNKTFALRFNYNNQSNDAATAWLDYFTVTALSKLKMVDEQLPFRYDSFKVNENYYPHFEIDNVTNPNTVIWDVTNPSQALQIPSRVTNAKLGFTTRLDKQKEFIAFNPQGTFPKPELVGKVANQNLQTLKNIDLVIISPQNFVADAERLAEAHRTADNLNAVVVTPEQVYNEFSSGTPDATAYRLLMRNVYSSSPADRANYLLLFGDGQFDNRALTNQKNLHDYLLTYQAENSIHLTDSYLCDDYFGFVKAGENIGEGKIDIGIGRLPVSTAAQAKGVADKIISYMNNSGKGYWKNQLVFLADDGDNHLHDNGADTVAKQTATLFPKFQIEKIYLDAYKQVTNGSVESYPQARERFQSLLKNGVMLFNYTGHGGTSGITNEGILTKTDVLSMTNENQAFWVTATCDFAVFDNPSIAGGSIGEVAILKSNGGAIGLYTTTRTVFSDRNDTMNQKLMPHMFEKDAQGNRLRLGDVMRLAKRDIADTNALTILNGLSYMLMADPALTLSYPEYNVVTDQIKGQAANSGVTLGALDRVEIIGHIADENGQTLTDFNGFVQVNLYDKEIIKKTLSNHGEGDNKLQFTDRDKITSATAQVTNGSFTTAILMPKSLSPEIGTGRLNYYAASENAEAYGNFENFSIGGEGETEPDENDKEGPAMSIYLNTPSFVSGSQVNETPTFFAELSDPNGINYSGSSSILNIGHDLKITLDNGTEYIVNDYFTADLGSYTSGLVKYTFPPLPTGKHHLEFKAWDMLNNSNSASLDFEVVAGLSVFQAKAYPNPAKTATTFHLEYNQPQNAQNYTLKVYDLTGRLVWTETQPANANANLTEIAWGLNVSGGQRLQTGIYLYNAEVLNRDGKTSVSKTQKLIIQ